jgi:hypothetical protein
MAGQENDYQPLLPKLKDNPSVSFTKVGTWELKNLSELDELSVSLMVERSGSVFDINAIPNMWARPLLFEMALFDGDHILHKHIKGEWRGLLAVLALKEIRSIAISTRAVEIPDQKEIPKNIPRFTYALSKLLPTGSIAEDTPWNTLYIILCNEKPIGMTSPITIVCTAADYYNRIHNVKWFDGKFLTDPITHLNQKEKDDLYTWLVNLRKKLVNYERRIDNNSFKSVAKLLTEFINDLGITNSENIKYMESSSGLGFTRGFFKLLDHPIAGGPIVSTDSQVLLKHSSDKSKPACDLLIVDQNIAEQWGIPEQDIIVISNATLASLPLGGVGAIRNRFGNTNLPSNTEIRVPQDFFTEKLFIIESANALPGSVTNIRGFDNLKFHEQPITPILPLKPVILTYLNNNELERRLSFEATSDGYRVKLKIPLSGPEGKGKDFEIKHEYKFANGDVEVFENIPVLEIWPNFKNDTWKAYYLYYDNAGQNTFYAKPFVQGTITAKPVKQNKNIKEIEITHTEYFPEALICENNSTQTIGIILLNQPLSILPINKSWKIGIDFGTTGTNVFLREDDDSKPYPIEFKERLFQVTKPGEAKRALVFDNFIIVDQNRRTSFLSIFQNFLNPTDVIEPLLNGHIYYLTDSVKFRAKNPGIMVDLKWGSQDERDNARIFLEQICLQCSAEAVNNSVKEISWRFSFPTAFTVENQEHFKSAWGLICENCYAKTGIKSVEEIPVSQTESVAIAKYFANMNVHGFNAAIYRGAVCIDIGGGTSDISIWQGMNNELKWQTSLLFAGRDIFLELFRSNPGFLGLFKVKGDLDYLAALKDNPKAFYAQLDAIIMQNGADMLKQLPQVAANTQVKEFVNIIALGLAGIFHYIGLLLHYLYSNELYNSKLMPNIYIGGNGANLFHWVAGGGFKPNSSVNSLFKNILVKATGFEIKEDFKIMLSDSLKAEVACGLVNDGSNLCYENTLKNNGIIAGEDFIVRGDKAGSWSTVLTSKMIKNGLEMTSDLNQLHEFLDRFNDLAEDSGVSPVKYQEDYFKDVRDGVNQKFAQISLNKSDIEKNIKVESIFISALKFLLALKAADWAKKE